MHVLVVDDDAGIQAQFERALSHLQHSSVQADRGQRALEILNDTHVDMLVIKRLLPDLNGIDLCRRVRALNINQFIHIMLCIEQDSRFELSQILDLGANDYVALPINPDELRIKLTLADRIITLERELNQKFTAIKRNYYQTIRAFAQLIEIYNAELGGHCRRVGALALSLAKRHPDMRPEDHPIVEAAGLLHDIGLIGLPEPVLKKRRTALTGEETVLFRSHSKRGETILTQMDLLKPVARLVRMHHEQYNGRGFPDGLSGEKIPLPARIIAAASMYDELVQREQIALKAIPQVLQQYRGYQLEPLLVELLLEIHLAMMQEEVGKDDRAVLISDLEEGMVLARDVIMTSGAFVMSADTGLDNNIIEKLKRYHESGNIMDRVFIRK